MKTASISLNVGLLTGKSFSVDVRLTDTVNDLKRRIEEEESIPRDSQVLIFREKPLANESFIGDLGIREGSKLQLVVQMNGGPGPPVRIRNPVKKDDSILFLLCKQDQGLYMLELHVKGDSGSPASKRLLKLADGQTLRVVSNGGKTILMGINPSELSDMDDGTSRPGSSDSSISTSSFLTYLDSSTGSSAIASCVPSQSTSRKTSASSSKFQRSKSSAMQLQKRGRSPRPATAISFMRQPNNLTQITFVKSRPATAAKAGSGDIQSSFLLDSASQPQEDRPSARGRSAKTVRFTAEAEETLQRASCQTATPPEAKRVSRTSTRSKISEEQSKSKRSGSSSSLKENTALQSFTSDTKSRRSSPWTPTTSTGMKREEPFKYFCSMCKKKLLFSTSFKCRCTRTFCSIHRYSDRHSCSYNYREAAKSELIKDNPKVIAKKVHEI